MVLLGKGKSECIHTWRLEGREISYSSCYSFLRLICLPGFGLGDTGYLASCMILENRAIY